MAANQMDDTTPPTDQPVSTGAATLAPEPLEPPPPPYFATTPRPGPAPGPRRQRLWTATLAAALLFTVGGVGLLYADDTTFQSSSNKLTHENQSLKSQNQTLEGQLKTTQTNLTATLGELASVRAQLEHPHLVIWNVPQQLKGSSWYLAGGAPDTFTYHLVASSTGPMSVSILTLEQWAKAIQCIDNGIGSTHYCMHHSGVFRSWLNVTSVNFDFHGAEGCADYLSVFTAASPVTVTPNVSVTYNPASAATGACA